MPESARESLEAELFRSTFWFQVSILIFLTFMQLTFVFVVPTWPLLLGLIYLVPLSIILVARLLISLDDDERRGQRRFAVTCSTVTVLGAITLVWVVQNHPELMIPQTEPGRAAGVHVIYAVAVAWLLWTQFARFGFWVPALHRYVFLEGAPIAAMLSLKSYSSMPYPAEQLIFVGAILLGELLGGFASDHILRARWDKRVLATMLSSISEGSPAAAAAAAAAAVAAAASGPPACCTPVDAEAAAAAAAFAADVGAALTSSGRRAPPPSAAAGAGLTLSQSSEMTSSRARRVNFDEAEAKAQIAKRQQQRSVRLNELIAATVEGAAIDATAGPFGAPAAEPAAAAPAAAEPAAADGDGAPRRRKKPPALGVSVLKPHAASKALDGAATDGEPSSAVTNPALTSGSSKSAPPPGSMPTAPPVGMPEDEREALLAALTFRHSFRFHVLIAAIGGVVHLLQAATSGLLVDACTVPIPLLFVWARVKAHRMADERRAHGNFTKTGLAMGIATPLGMFVALTLNLIPAPSRSVRRDYGVVLCLVAFMASNLFTSFRLGSQLAVVASHFLVVPTLLSTIETNPERQVEFAKLVFAAAVGAAVGYLLERTQRGHVVGVMSLREEYSRALSELMNVSAGERSLLARAFSNHRLPPEILLTRVELDDLKLDAVLGQGSFGIVHSAVWTGPPHATGGGAMPVATKTMHRSRLNAADLETCVRAAGLQLRLAAHANVAKLHGVGWHVDSGRVVLVMELAPGGSLAAALGRHALPVRTQLAVALAVARGLAFLHGQGPPVIHRDLKPDNILLGRTAADAKIGDFGLSRHSAAQLQQTMSTEVGTPMFSAPELLAHELYDHSVDVWSYGCVLACLGLDAPAPYDAADHGPGLLGRVQKGELRPILPPDAPLATAVRDATERQPKARPTADDLVARLEVLCAAENR